MEKRCRDITNIKVSADVSSVTFTTAEAYVQEWRRMLDFAYFERLSSLNVVAQRPGHGGLSTKLGHERSNGTALGEQTVHKDPICDYLATWPSTNVEG